MQYRRVSLTISDRSATSSTLNELILEFCRMLYCIFEDPEDGDRRSRRLHHFVVNVNSTNHHKENASKSKWQKIRSSALRPLPNLQWSETDTSCGIDWFLSLTPSYNSNSKKSLRTSSSKRMSQESSIHSSPVESDGHPRSPIRDEESNVLYMLLWRLINQEKHEDTLRQLFSLASEAQTP